MTPSRVDASWDDVPPDAEPERASAEPAKLGPAPNPAKTLALGTDGAAEPAAAASETAPSAEAKPIPPPKPSKPTRPPPPPLRPQKPAKTMMGPFADAKASEPPPAPRLKSGALEGPSPRSAPPLPHKAAVEKPKVPIGEELAQLIARRSRKDDVGAAWAMLEKGIHLERAAHDTAGALAAYHAARAACPTIRGVLARLRRSLTKPGDHDKALEICIAELDLAGDDVARADLLVEAAHHAEALGKRADARKHFERALSLVPAHPAALRGLEVSLRSGPAGDAAALAAHLERVAETVTPPREDEDGDRRLAAWIWVERASILDRSLKQPEAAEASLERAVALVSPPGPVRHALTRHLLRHGRRAELAKALAAEAEGEGDSRRAARLLYAAARIEMGLGQNVDAALLLEKATAKNATPGLTGPRVYDELIRLHEQNGEDALAAEVRRARLATFDDPERLAHEHAQLSRIFERIGDHESSVWHAEKALGHWSDDDATRAHLDHCLDKLGKHERRVEWFLYASKRDRPPRFRADALLRAAEITDQKLGRRQDAIGHLSAAWTIDEGHPRVFEMLAGLLAPPPIDPDSPQAGARGVRGRIDLYTRGAASARLAARKVALLEKLLSIWEDELNQPARAAEVAEQILLLSPKRHTALLALGRTALRAGDWKRVVGALTTEAELLGEGEESRESEEAARQLWLRAAEISAETLGDADRALGFVERALAADKKAPDALRTKWQIALGAGRHAEARKALVSLIEARSAEGQASAGELFELWLEVARLDEVFLKRPSEAVTSYDQAGKVSPDRTVVAEEVARLLAQTGDFKRLAAVLSAFAKRSTHPERKASLLLATAEIQEAKLGDDAAAIRSLLDADAALSGAGGGAESAQDTSALEAAEHIQARRDDLPALASLYRRWLERQPPLPVAQMIKVALAEVLGLSQDKPREAIEVARELLATAPDHVPAQRILEQLYRRDHDKAELSALLDRQLTTLSSPVARRGILWELCRGREAASEARRAWLRRLVHESPGDRMAWEHLAREAAFASAAAQAKPLAAPLVGGAAIEEEEIELDAVIEEDTGGPAPHGDGPDGDDDLVTALEALANHAEVPRERAAYHLELALVLEERARSATMATRDEVLRQALVNHRAALAGWTDSLVAARGVERLAALLSDDDAALAAELALAEIAEDKQDKAAHLCRASKLVARAEGSSANAVEQAAAYLERALDVDPDCAEAASELPLKLVQDPQRLADRFQGALERAKDRSQRRRLGQHLAQLALDPLKNPGLGVDAIKKVLADDPGDGPTTMLLARLLSAEGAWVEARDILQKVAWPSSKTAAKDATDARLRLAAHLELARLYMGSLEDPAAARKELDSVLEIDGKHRAALELMLALATKTADRELAAKSLNALVDDEADPAARVELDLRLAEQLRQMGDGEGVTKALCDAIVTMPKEPRAYKLLSEMFRRETREGAEAFAKALHSLIELATARRVPIESTWISTLGLLEATILGRHDDGLARLQQAANVLGAPPDTHVALARGLAGVGRNVEAIQILREGVLAPPDAWARLGDLTGTLEFWEATLSTEGRAEERLVVEELRAALGVSTGERAGWLRKRPLVPRAPYADSFAAGDLAQLLVPEARSPAIDVRLALSPMVAKAVRFDLGNLSVSGRERVGPRDGNPIRAVADQLARALGVQYELYVVPGWRAPARVCPGDPPAIVVSAAYANLNQGELAFALGRLMGLIALGAAWLEDVSPDEVDAVVIAMLRVAEPEFGLGELGGPIEENVSLFADRARKAVGWLQKRRLDEARQIVARAADALTPVASIERSADQIGYALCGNLVGAIDYLRRTNDDIAKAAETSKGLISHPRVAALCRYALGDDAYQARRRAGVLYLSA